MTVQAITHNPTDSITHSKHISSALSFLYQVMNPSPENRMRDYEEDPNTPSPEQIWRLNMSPRLGGVLDPATQIVRSNHFQGACHMCVFLCCCCVARYELLRAIKPLCDIRYYLIPRPDPPRFSYTSSIVLNPSLTSPYSLSIHHSPSFLFPVDTSKVPPKVCLYHVRTALRRGPTAQCHCSVPDTY